MSRGVAAESPLARYAFSIGSASPDGRVGVRLCERPFLGHLILRGEPARRNLTSGVKRVLGVSLPRKPNTVAAADDVKILWLGPDEWLVVTPPGRESEIVPALRGALVKAFASVTDVSSAQTVINIEGPKARDALAKGCPLDLHPRAFASGQSAQSRIAKADAIIHQLDDTPSFDLFVRRSFAEYLWSWLTDAGGEYGIVVSAHKSLTG